METEVPAARQLLIVEDDAAFARTLSRSFERRGYAVLSASSFADVIALLPANSPGFAVVDLKLAGEASGLACVQALHAHDPAMLIVVLTGFASIATAVEAIKLGACHYLAKQDARVGAHPRDAGRDRLQHLRDRATARHAPPHAGAQTGQAARQMSGRRHGAAVDPFR